MTAVHSVLNPDNHDVLIAGNGGDDIIWAGLARTRVHGDETSLASCNASSGSGVVGHDILMGSYYHDLYGCRGDDLILGGGSNQFVIRDSMMMPWDPEEIHVGLGDDCIESRHYGNTFEERGNLSCDPSGMGSGDSYRACDGNPTGPPCPDFSLNHCAAATVLTTTACLTSWPMIIYF